MIYSRKITQGGARKDANRRDMVNDSLADLSRRIDDLDGRLDTVSKQLVEFLDADRERWVAFDCHVGTGCFTDCQHPTDHYTGAKKCTEFFLRLWKVRPRRGECRVRKDHFPPPHSLSMSNFNRLDGDR